MVKFEHTDEFMDQINNRQEVINLADFLLCNDSFVHEFYMLIRDGSSTQRFNKWKYNYLLRNGVSLKKKEQKFLDLLEDMYAIAKEPHEEFSEQKYVGIIRGSVLEVYIRKLIEVRHKGSIYSNCQVKIGGKTVAVGEGRPQTIDIGLYDKKFTEMYECKVSEHRFEPPKLMFLQHLTEILCKNGSLEFIVAGVSLSDQKALDRRFINCEKVACFGRSNLKKLANFKEANEFAKKRFSA